MQESNARRMRPQILSFERQKFSNFHFQKRKLENCISKGSYHFLLHFYSWFLNKMSFLRICQYEKMMWRKWNNRITLSSWNQFILISPQKQKSKVLSEVDAWKFSIWFLIFPHGWRIQKLKFKKSNNPFPIIYWMDSRTCDTQCNIGSLVFVDYNPFDWSESMVQTTL